MRLHLLQTDIAWEDRAANLARAQELLEAAPPSPGAVIVLPEMFDTGFSRDTARTADNGDARRWLADTARRYDCAVLASVTIAPTPQTMNLARNRAVLVGRRGEVVAQYDKVHPFSVGRENESFSGGDRVVVADLPDDDGPAKVCPLVCYDLRFPELFRAGRMLGAEVYFVIANWPAPRIGQWRALCIARAIENQAFVVAVSRVGKDPLTAYAGGSIVVGPKGDVIAEGGEREGPITAEIAASEARAWRAKFRVWQDARPGLLPRIDAQGRFAPD